jgi:hypothetical protein
VAGTDNSTAGPSELAVTLPRWRRDQQDRRERRGLAGCRARSLDETDPLYNAMSFMTPLSIAIRLDRLVPRLASALDVAPRTARTASPQISAWYTKSWRVLQAPTAVAIGDSGTP